MNVKTAFLHSVLEESVFMEIPEGVHTNIPSTTTNGQRIVCRLIKSIYGLKQAPRAWYGKIHKFFLDHGFQRSEQDHSVYVHRVFKLILLLYVDDLVITSATLTDVSWIQNLLHEEYEMTELGPLTTFLGLEIKRNRHLRILHLGQQRYIEAILARHGMSTCTPIGTPRTHMSAYSSQPRMNKQISSTGNAINLPWDPLCIR